ncbi:hypothetical protein MD484_g6972, partial [Candolleomyces efflorescens]
MVVLSDLLGLASIGCWLGAQLPQVIENIRRQSCDGLALPFLANWLLGDISNLVGCILTHQLPFQTWLATYFVIVDCALVGQYFYYERAPSKASHFGHARPPTTPGTRRVSIERGHSRYRTLSAVAANVAAAAALAAQKEEEQLPPGSSRSLRPYPTYGADDLHTGLPSAYEEDREEDGEVPATLGDSFYSEGGRSIGRKRLAWSVERSGNLGVYPPPRSTTPTALRALSPETATREGLAVNTDEPEQEETEAPASARRSSRASRRGATMVFLSTWALFGIGSIASRGVVPSTSPSSVGRLLFPNEGSLSVAVVPAPQSDSSLILDALHAVPRAAYNEFSAITLPPSEAGENGHIQLSTAKQEHDHPKEEPDFERVLGRMFAWICTTLYLTSRLPQIWKNYVRKSVEGLSMYLFVFAFLGNTFYVASILLSPKTYLPPPESTNFIRESIPYLLGSSGTLMFDITIVTQSFIYRPRPKRQHTTPRLLEEEAGLLASDALSPHPPLDTGSVMSTISFSTQKKGASSLKSPTAYQLRSLVLDYLCHHCYTSTARAFIRDSTVKELDADGDEISGGAEPSRWPSSSAEAPEVLLQNVKRRSEIRELILAGQLDDAIELLNKYFPSVLSESSSPSERASFSNPEGGFTYVSATSVEAAHLLLNLRILAFIEACRTRPLDVPHPTKAPFETITSNTSPQSNLSASMDTTEHSTHLPTLEPGVRDIDPDVLDALLRKGRKLYALVSALPNPKDREVYKQELKNVGGILAYKIPEESPVAKYLAYQRREAVADQINRAVLHRTGSSPTSSIELLTRYTTALWETAQEHKVKVRPGAVIPPVASSPPEGRSDEADEVPLFDLRQFLDSKP